MLIKPLTKEIIKNLWNQTSEIEEYLHRCYDTQFKVKEKPVLIKHSNEGFRVYYDNIKVSGGMNFVEKFAIMLLFHMNRLSKASAEKSLQKNRIRKALHLEK
jgi:hypothetical protein